MGRLDLGRLSERIEVEHDRSTRLRVARQCYSGLCRVLDNRYRPMDRERPDAPLVLSLFDEAYFRLLPTEREKFARTVATRLDNINLKEEADVIRSYAHYKNLLLYVEEGAVVFTPPKLVGQAKHIVKFAYEGTTYSDLKFCESVELLAPRDVLKIDSFIPAIPPGAVSFDRAERYARPRARVEYKREV